MFSEISSLQVFMQIKNYCSFVQIYAFIKLVPRICNSDLKTSVYHHQIRFYNLDMSILKTTVNTVP